MRRGHFGQPAILFWWQRWEGINRTAQSRQLVANISMNPDWWSGHYIPLFVGNHFQSISMRQSWLTYNYCIWTMNLSASIKPWDITTVLFPIFYVEIAITVFRQQNATQYQWKLINSLCSNFLCFQRHSFRFATMRQLKLILAVPVKTQTNFNCYDGESNLIRSDQDLGTLIVSIKWNSIPIL